MFLVGRRRVAGEVRAQPETCCSRTPTPATTRSSRCAATASVLHDPQRAKELWSKIAEAWFPGGPDDPNLALLRITLSSAEHWEPPQGKVVQFVEIADGRAHPQRRRSDDEHRRIVLGPASRDVWHAVR